MKILKVDGDTITFVKVVSTKATYGVPSGPEDAKGEKVTLTTLDPIRECKFYSVTYDKRTKKVGRRPLKDGLKNPAFSYENVRANITVENGFSGTVNAGKEVVTYIEVYPDLYSAEVFDMIIRKVDDTTITGRKFGAGDADVTLKRAKNFMVFKGQAKFNSESREFEGGVEIGLNDAIFRKGSATAVSLP